MTTRTGNHAPVGCPDWITKEHNEISGLCENELEDFTFSARNEVEWLNEHMMDIFSTNQLNLAEILKTPGKLRGKTPRTVRQRSPLKAHRQPLGDIAPVDKRFNSPLRKTPIKTCIEEQSQHEENALPVYKQTDTQKTANPTQDSGYGGYSPVLMVVDIPLTQDLEADEERDAALNGQSLVEISQDTVNREPAEDKRSTEGSFHSAKENQTARDIGQDTEMTMETQTHMQEATDRASEQLRRETAEHVQRLDEEMKDSDQNEIEANDGLGDNADASSQESTPAKPLVRKGSLTFATLPPRDPLATKKSMGTRVSSQNTRLDKSGYFGRITGGKSLGAALQDDIPVEQDALEHSESSRPDSKHKEPEGTMSRLHSKSSTQRLHERINALGKSQAVRPTKSIPSLAASAQPAYPVLPDAQALGRVGLTQEDLIHETENHAKQNEGQVMAEAEPEKLSSALPGVVDQAGPQPEVVKVTQSKTQDLFENRPSTTPRGSPPKHLVEQHGPVSASKWKLQSLMQSARGLFSSSAAASAQAKLEAGSITSPKKPQPDYPTISSLALTSALEPRRTRSSTEKEQLLKREQEAEAMEIDRPPSRPNHEAVTGVECQPDEQHDQMGQTPGQLTTEDPQDELTEERQDRAASAMGPPARPRTVLSKSGAVRRPIAKPTKEQPTQQKVSIKVGSMASRRPLTAGTLSTASKVAESSSHQRPGTAGKKESTASHSTTGSSTASFKSSGMSSVTKPKALLAAERKKEADEKAAQKKLEAKREMERRKAAQQEEAQRREQERQDAERQKERERQADEEKKKQEQRLAAEKRRAEQLVKQREREAEQQQALKASFRAEAAPARPPSRQAMLGDFPRPPNGHPPTVSKAPSKRVWNPDHEDEAARPPRTQPGQSYQLGHDGKRRKTDDEEVIEQPSVRPTMAPPKRISSTAKSGPKVSIFGNNYPRAPPPASHHYGVQQNSASTQPAPYQQPIARPGTAMDMNRFQNGAIPFVGGQSATTAAALSTATVYKTPHQTKYGQAPAPSTAQGQPKSSPFINGEYLHLDEIPTDSEDEDSDTERERKANLPDWVLSPNLNQALMDQEPMNPDAVFGPMAPLNMEEIFKDRKGQARFRSRTSSANWFGNDRLTDEEKVRDLEGRDRIRREGGWTFGL